MGILNSGAPASEVQIIDLTSLIEGALKGYVCVIGETARGVIGKPVFCGNWPDFEKKLGGLQIDNDFPLICKRALDGGAKLYVSRSGHYTDPTDASTLQGTKAQCTPAIAAVTEVRATATYTVTAGTLAGVGVHVIKVGTTTIGSYTVQSGDTLAQQATAIAAAIQTLTGTTGYNASAAGAVVTVQAPVGQGAAANTLVLTDANTGDADGTATAFANGVTAVIAQSIIFKAKEVGAGYNGIVVSITPAASGDATKVDIVVTVPGSEAATETYKDVTKVLGGTEMQQINTKSQLFTMMTMVANLPIATATMAGGVQAIIDINNADYIGDAVAKTGIWSFGDITDAMHIAIPHQADHDLSVALQNYVETRGDMLALVSTPIGLNGDGVVEYRDRTGGYATGVPINSWQMLMFTGGLNVYDPKAQVNKDITELGDVLGLFARTHAAKGEWWSPAGLKRGLIKNNNGVVFNFGAPDEKPAHDRISIRGVNAVIKHPTAGPVLWGNETLYKQSGSILKAANVAELVIFMKRTLKPLLESVTFDPNEFATWRELYRKVNPFLQKLKDQRAIFDYLYQGDQEATKLTDLVINNPDDVQAGIYVVNVLIKPIGALKWITMRLALVNNSVDFTAVSEADLQ